MSQPDITVIVVSDFEAGEKTWSDEIKMMRAFAEQDIDAPFKTVIVENEANRAATPPQALFDAIPDLEIVYYPSDKSSVLKDFGVSQCETEWVAVFEADAVPEPGWLRLAYDAARANTWCDIVSGRTWYGDETAWKRASNLLHRSYDDPGKSQKSLHVSNNAALYRTAVIRKFPYPDAATPFASGYPRTRAMRESGVMFYACREARTRHAISGWDFFWDVHRNVGFTDMSLPLERGYHLIPSLVFRRLRNQIGNALRVGREYLKPLDWPLWAFLLVASRAPEIRGMHEALSEPDSLKRSAYR
ncbi:MAG: glycosyltransferase [Pseudomonadota bacterium]